MCWTQLASKLSGSSLEEGMRNACGGLKEAGLLQKKDQGRTPSSMEGAQASRHHKRRPFHTLFQREVRSRPAGLSEREKRELVWRRLPCGRPSLMAKFGCRVYGGRFSQDGDIYICSTQVSCCASWQSCLTDLLFNVFVSVFLCSLHVFAGFCMFRLPVLSVCLPSSFLLSCPKFDECHRI